MMVTMPGVSMCPGMVDSTRPLVTAELANTGTPQGVNMVTRHMARLQMSVAEVSLVMRRPSLVMMES